MVQFPVYANKTSLITTNNSNSYITDYACSGVNDNVQFQEALNALPSSGGQITIGPGTYNFAEPIFRAIDNVIIEGAGVTTILKSLGSSSIISAGSQTNWVFRDFKIDAGGIDIKSATKWIEDNVTIGSTYYTYRSSNSFQPPSQTLFNVSPVGSNDQTQIQNAISSGHNNLLLSAGIWDIKGNIYIPSNTKMNGMGNTTILNFSSSRISISDASNVEIGNFEMTGTITPDAGIDISASNSDQSNFFVHDITSEALGGSIFNLYVNSTGHSNRTISNVEFVKCSVNNPDGFGFIGNGEGDMPSLTNINYYKCQVTNAGIANFRINDYVTDYDLVEYANLSLKYNTMIDCCGNGSWESIFHYEVAPIKIGCVMIQCSANGGGQKPNAVYGDGFLFGPGVTIYTSSATNNAHTGFDYVNGSNHDAGAEDDKNSINCVAYGNGDIVMTQTKYIYTIDTSYSPPSTVNVTVPQATSMPNPVWSWRMIDLFIIMLIVVAIILVVILIIIIRKIHK